MCSNLEILYTDNQLIIKKLSHKKIIIEYKIPLYFAESDRKIGYEEKPNDVKPISEPLELIKVKMRYQFDRQDKCYKIIPNSKSYVVGCVSGRYKIKVRDILCISNSKTIFDKITVSTLVVSLCVVGSSAHSIVRDSQINKILNNK